MNEARKQLIEKIADNRLDAGDFYKPAFDELSEISSSYGYISKTTPEIASKQLENLFSLTEIQLKAKKLIGFSVSFKDCICVKGVETTSSSAILRGYKPVFNATVVEKAIEAGAVIVAKTVQDEFGFGTFSANTGKGYEIPKNPFDKERVCGGSSGGSAGLAQKFNMPHISIAESTGGSIVAPAAFCGVVGLCPSYSRVSRYGLLDYSNSNDKIGPITKTVEDAAIALEVISGYDERDSTSSDKAVDSYSGYTNEPVKGKKIAVVKEAFDDSVDDAIKKRVWDRIAELESEGASYEEISMPLNLKYSVPCYYLIATAEASTNLARYCGLRYGEQPEINGNFNDFFKAVRTKHFGTEAKRRILLGTFARMAGHRDAYYLKALKLRTRLINEYKSLFKDFDAIVSPTMPLLPPKLEDIKKLTPMQSYMMDILTVGPNLAGLPHISVNAGFEKNLPCGIMFVADHFNEKELIRFGANVEKGKN